LVHRVPTRKRDSFERAFLMRRYDQVGYFSNAPFLACKDVGFRIPAIAATECAALEVNDRSQAGSVDPAAATKPWISMFPPPPSAF
jgi:hypothetical protein